MKAILIEFGGLSREFALRETALAISEGYGAGSIMDESGQEEGFGFWTSIPHGGGFDILITSDVELDAHTMASLVMKEINK